MRGRAPTYPGLADPRAALEPFREPYDRLAELRRRFHISAPAYDALAAVNASFRHAATLLTNDPYFFGGGPGGQTVHRTPEAPPIPGIVRAPLVKPSKIKHPT